MESVQVIFERGNRTGHQHLRRRDLRHLRRVQDPRSRHEDGRQHHRRSHPLKLHHQGQSHAGCRKVEEIRKKSKSCYPRFQINYLENQGRPQLQKINGYTIKSKINFELVL